MVVNNNKYYKLLHKISQYSGIPCMPRNDYGKGNVYYLGCDLDERAMEKLANFLLSQAKIPVEGEYKEMISREKIEKIVFLKPYDVAILS